MNPLIEACKQCPVKDDCPLDRRAEQVLADYRSGDIDQGAVKTRIGRVSQIGNQNNCPKREIERVRKELYKEMAPGQNSQHYFRTSYSSGEKLTSYESGNYDTLENGGAIKRR